jgi:hypothetical protein
MIPHDDSQKQPRDPQPPVPGAHCQGQAMLPPVLSVPPDSTAAFDLTLSALIDDLLLIEHRQEVLLYHLLAMADELHAAKALVEETLP